MAIFSKEVSFPTHKDDPVYIMEYMPRDLHTYIETDIIRKKYPEAIAHEFNVEWDIFPKRAVIAMSGENKGELGTFIIEFRLPSGRALEPDFEEA